MDKRLRGPASGLHPLIDNLIYAQRAFAHWHIGGEMQEAKFPETCEDPAILRRNMMSLLMTPVRIATMWRMVATCKSAQSLCFDLLSCSASYFPLNQRTQTEFVFAFAPSQEGRTTWYWIFEMPVSEVEKAVCNLSWT